MANLLPANQAPAQCPPEALSGKESSFHLLNVFLGFAIFPMGSALSVTVVGSSSRATHWAILLEDGKDIRNPFERFPGCLVCHGRPPRGHRMTNFCARPLAGSQIRDPECWHVSQPLCRTSSCVKNPESLFLAGLSRALSQQNCLSGPNLNPCVLTSWYSSRSHACLETTCLGPAAARGQGDTAEKVPRSERRLCFLLHI